MKKSELYEPGTQSRNDKVLTLPQTLQPYIKPPCPFLCFIPQYKDSCMDSTYKTLDSYLP
jgi:hypothetical protein